MTTLTAPAPLAVSVSTPARCEKYWHLYDLLVVRSARNHDPDRKSEDTAEEVDNVLREMRVHLAACPTCKRWLQWVEEQSSVIPKSDTTKGEK